MSADVPRQLLNKRQDVAHAAQELEAKALALRAQLAVLDQAIAILAPGWKAPAGTARKRPVKVQEGAAGAGGHGDVARETLRALKDAPDALTTTAIATAIAESRGVTFKNRTDRKRLISAVLSAAKRLEAKGVAEQRKTNHGRGPLGWALRRPAE